MVRVALPKPIVLGRSLIARPLASRRTISKTDESRETSLHVRPITQLSVPSLVVGFLKKKVELMGQAIRVHLSVPVCLVAITEPVRNGPELC
jgi:hypothetical protein